jgi:adenylosuccinate synthase
MRRLALAPAIQPLVADVAAMLQSARRAGESLLFEGAQGALLDIDHGTYPYVTSSNCLAGAAAPGSGIGPQMLDYVLGIVKAYTTRVGTGPFPTELTDETGAWLAMAVTSSVGHRRPAAAAGSDVRARAPAARTAWTGSRSPSLTCSTACRRSGSHRVHRRRRALALLSRAPEAVAPVYRCTRSFRWQESTFGVKSFDALPPAARTYLRRIEVLTGVPIAMISTGPERDETILVHHPFH